MLGRVQKTSRWSAERRGVGSLRRRALASKVRARVRSCTHSGCTQHPGAYRRSARPSSGRHKKKEQGRKKAEGEKNEDQRNKFVARMSEATGGAPPGGIPDIASLSRATARGCLTL